MTVSVVVPAYNAARFIVPTLDAVLEQSAPADEILVLDDGSSDATRTVLARYGRAVTVLSQPNRGVACARNRLCACAGGDLVAFLDHDDVWHPDYLAVQRRNFESWPQAVALFTGHVDIADGATPRWDSPTVADRPAWLIDAADFLPFHARRTACFASMSYCCMPRQVLAGLGAQPFPVAVSGADDYYLCNLLPLLGPVVCDTAALVAYRYTAAAQSADQLRSCRLAVQALDLLDECYRSAASAPLRREFEAVYSAKSRHYAKLLLGQGRCRQARHELHRALRVGGGARSRLKTSALWLASLLPRAWQPPWLPAQRVERLPS
ncbi:MAG: hypothetical protein RLZZ584_2966 [Pseudomonadota bacterium]|jgi:glycosyltransferase involved in cell wall biosynthesis